MTTVPNFARLALKQDFTRDGDTLVIHYRVTNPGPQAVYLMNRIIDPRPWSLRPDNILIVADREARVLEFRKELADVPVGSATPMAPYPTPLPVDGVFTETVRVPPPVREWTQYKRAQGEPTESFAKVRLRLGYHDKPLGLRELPDKDHGIDVILTRLPEGKVLHFGEVASPVVTLETPLKVALLTAEQLSLPRGARRGSP